AAARQAAVEPHRAALEPELGVVAGARVVAVLAATGGLAVAGSRSAADAPALGALGSGVEDVVHHHASVTPRSASTCAFERSDCRPLNVAFTRLIAFVWPLLLVSTSFTPASSITARTVPPATMPVPGAAGIMRISEASNFASIGCGIVVPTRGTSTRLFFASFTPFSTALGTARALPNPKPTLPSRLPTTTSAEKEKRRPPFITLAQRFTLTTISWKTASPSSSPPRRRPPPSPLP